jgi:transcription antitermination factor NusG
VIVNGGFEIEENKTALEWFALRVRSNCEWIAAGHLKAKGFAICLPRWQRRDPSKKKVAHREFALFPGYVFCRFDRRSLLPIVSVPWVIDIVSCGKTPEAVDPLEMQGILQLEESGVPCLPHTYAAVGQAVKVCAGPLSGVEGIFVRDKGRDRFVLSVSLLQRSVIVEVDSCFVMPVKTKDITRVA